MKKQVIILSLIISAIVFLLGITARRVNAGELLTGEATIISAKYQDDRFILQLEMDDKIYTGRLNKDLTYGDYLSLHHNVGMVVEILYEFDNNELVIYSWKILK